MNKLLELEKRLKEAKAQLEKAAEEDKKKKNEDEKEDKKLIANAIDRHNEDKHDEPKDEDSAKKDLRKAAGGPNKFGERKQAEAENTVREQRAPAVSIDPKSGAKTLVTPDQQVKAQVDAKAAKKAKFEADAKARRDSYRKQGLVKFDENGQWSMGDE